MQHWDGVIDIPMKTIHYEAMVESPEKSARELLDFCGLGWDDAVLGFHKSKRMVSTASYAQVRQPIYKTSIQRWKCYEHHLEPLRELLNEHVLAYEDELAGNKSP